MNKKGFTLIEMLIVIVIIGILLTLSMRISGDRIQVLKTKSVWEQVVYNYNNLYVKNLLTNYYGQEMYENMIIRFSKGDTKLNYFYKMSSTDDSVDDNNRLSEIVQGGKYEVENVYFDGKNIGDSAYLIFEPYKIGCFLSNDYTDYEGPSYKKLDIELLVNTNKKYCFEISSDLCKLKVIDCK